MNVSDIRMITLTRDRRLEPSTVNKRGLEDNTVGSMRGAQYAVVPAICVTCFLDLWVVILALWEADAPLTTIRFCEGRAV